MTPICPEGPQFFKVEVYPLDETFNKTFIFSNLSDGSGSGGLGLGSPVRPGWEHLEKL